MSDAICDSCKRVNLSALKAAHTGHLQCLQAAFVEAPDKSCAGDSKGATALHLSARAGHAECLDWLLKNSGMDPKCKAKNGETSAHLAASQGKLECMKLLYAHDPSTMTTKDRYGQIPLHLATLRNKLECVEWLVEDEKNSPKAKNQTGATAVHFAAALNDIGCVKALLRGAGNKAVNWKDDNGTTPIYFASQEGHLDMVKFMAATCKGDALARSADGMTSVHATTQGGHLELLQWLVKKLGENVITDATADGGTPIHFAAAMGRYECLRWLLSTKKGKKAVKVTDHDGGTAAHDAADNGQTDCLRLLVDHGADLHVKDKDGYTPYELAVQGGHEETSEYVIQLTGGDLSRGQSPPKVEDNSRQDVTQFDAWNEPMGLRDASKPIMAPIYSMSSLVSDQSLQRMREESVQGSPTSKEPENITLKPEEIALKPQNPALVRVLESHDSRRTSTTPSLAEGPPPPNEDDLDLVDPVILSTPGIARASLVRTPRQSPRTIPKRLTRDMDDEAPGYAELETTSADMEKSGSETNLRSDTEPSQPAPNANDPDPIYATVNKPSLKRKKSEKEGESSKTSEDRPASLLADALRVAAANENRDGAETSTEGSRIAVEVEQAPPVPLQLQSEESARPPTPPPPPKEEPSETPVPLQLASAGSARPPTPPPLPRDEQSEPPVSLQLPSAGNARPPTPPPPPRDGLSQPPVPLQLPSTGSARPPTPPPPPRDELSEPPVPPPVPQHLERQRSLHKATVTNLPLQLIEEESSSAPAAPPVPKNLDQPVQDWETPVKKHYSQPQRQQPLPFKSSPIKIQSLPPGADPMGPLVAMRQQRESMRQIEQSIKQKQSNDRTRGAGSELKKKLMRRQEYHQTSTKSHLLEVDGQ